LADLTAEGPGSRPSAWWRKVEFSIEDVVMSHGKDQSIGTSVAEVAIIRVFVPNALDLDLVNDEVQAISEELT